MEFKLSARTDVGKVRDHNEDNYIVCPDLAKEDWFLTTDLITLSEKGALLIIADGMGGLNAGEIASKIAVETMREYFLVHLKDGDETEADTKLLLTEAINAAQQKMVSHAKEFPETKGMGTTIVMALIKENIVHTAWVGDSRCYVFRDRAELFFATKDHSYIQKLVDKQKITTEEAFYHPDSNIITRSLGDENSTNNVPDFCSFPLQDGDRVLLCTDGLNSMLQDAVIARILKQEPDISNCCNKLIDAANEAGGADNITVVLFDIITLKEKELNTNTKLHQLRTAAVCDVENLELTPFNTLKPVEIDSLLSEKKSTKKPGLHFLLISIISALAIALIVYFVLKPPESKSLYGVTKPKKDSVVQKLKPATIEDTLSRRRNTLIKTVSTEFESSKKERESRQIEGLLKKNLPTKKKLDSPNKKTKVPIPTPIEDTSNQNKVRRPGK